MTSLSESDISAYEQYLTATTDSEREEALKKLIPGSLQYYYLYFIDILKKQEGNLNSEQLKTLDEFKKRFKNSQ